MATRQTLPSVYVSMPAGDSSRCQPVLDALTAWGVRWRTIPAEALDDRTGEDWSDAVWRQLYEQDFIADIKAGGKDWSDAVWRQLYEHLSEWEGKGYPGWLAMDEQDLVLRIVTAAGVRDPRLRMELAAVHKLRIEDEKAGLPHEQRLIELRLDPGVAGDDPLPPGSRVVEAGDWSRRAWMPKLADALGIVVVAYGPPSAPTLDTRETRALWRAARPSANEGQIALDRARGTVLSTGRDGVLAVDAHTGQRRWHTTRVRAANYGRIGAPAVNGELLYVPTGSPTIYALSARDGARLGWEAAADGDVNAAPAVGDGVVVVPCDDGYLYGFDVADGRRRWRVRTGPRGSSFSSPVIVDGVAYAAGKGSYVVAVRPADGELLWRRLTSGHVRGTPAVAKDLVYVASDDVYALDARDGTVRWQTAPLPSESTASELVLVGDSLLGTIASHIQRLVCLSALDGSLRWSVDLGAWTFGPPAVAGGVVYMANANTLQALDLENGAPLWQYVVPPGQRITWGPPRVYEDSVLFTAGRFVYAVGAGTK